MPGASGYSSGYTAGRNRNRDENDYRSVPYSTTTGAARAGATGLGVAAPTIMPTAAFGMPAGQMAAAGGQMASAAGQMAMMNVPGWGGMMPPFLHGWHAPGQPPPLNQFGGPLATIPGPPPRRSRRMGGMGSAAAARDMTPPPALPVLSSEDVADPQCFIDAAARKDVVRCRAIIAHKDFTGINEKDSERRSILHVAAVRKIPQDLCLQILKNPAFEELNAVDEFGYTSLALAASNGYTELCMAIIAREDFTEVNRKDKWGATALHWAASSNLGSVCTAILEHSGFVEARMTAYSFKFQDQTALQVALDKGCNDAAAAIRCFLNAPF